jgi:hypothetical protein
VQLGSRLKDGIPLLTPRSSTRNYRRPPGFNTVAKSRRKVEDFAMLFLRSMPTKPALLAAAACLCGFAIAGCDEYVRVTRDPDARIARGETWAWRPDAPPPAVRNRDNRPVVSRDAIPRADQGALERDNEANNQIVRDRVKNSIAQTLTEKGLRQVSDPAAADFLVDYHFAVERRNQTIQTVYPGGGYPGLVCGPFRCYEAWGWGPPEIGYEHIRFREGTIVFDMLQQSTKHLVYRAIGQKPLQRDTFTLTQDEINGLVHKLLKDLKPRK